MIVAEYQLAQLNIARIRYATDDPGMAGFMDNLDRINKLGDDSPGFVWRHQDESGSSTETLIFDEPDILLNYTIWEDVESLKHYVYKTEHKDFLRRRREWFVPLPEWPVTVMWWVPSGTIPDILEAKDKLIQLRDHGSTPEAFSFREPFPPPA